MANAGEATGYTFTVVVECVIHVHRDAEPTPAELADLARAMMIAGAEEYLGTTSGVTVTLTSGPRRD